MEQASGMHLSIKERKDAHTQAKPITTMEDTALIPTKYFKDGENSSSDNSSKGSHKE